MFDLFEMKRVSSIHYNISSDMNATNIRLIGACEHIPHATKNTEHTEETEEGQDKEEQVS